jgi:hypothetical protein
MIISLSFPQKYQKIPIFGQNPDIFHRFCPKINTISTQLTQTILSIQQIHSIGLDLAIDTVAAECAAAFCMSGH